MWASIFLMLLALLLVMSAVSLYNVKVRGKRSPKEYTFMVKQNLNEMIFKKENNDLV